MLERMTTKDAQFSVAGYAQRARSALYRSTRDAHPLSTLDAFDEARRRFPKVGAAWVSRLCELRRGEHSNDCGSDCSCLHDTTARNFALQVVAANTKRLRLTAEAAR